MTDTIKLSVLGGSGVATPVLIEALARRADRPAMQVVLMGRTAGKLEQVASLARSIASQADGPPLTVEATIDERRGLEGATYVLNQVRVGGYEARAYDESYPRKFGIPGEETFGPGGLSNALRTIPVALEHCRLLEQVAPSALMINLTNPSSFIQYAINQYTNVSVLGVCDSPVGLREGLAKVIGAPPDELWIDYIGMHHFGWVTGAQWNGRDVMPEILEKADQIPGLPVDAAFVRAMGAVPTSYFKYFYHADRMLATQEGKPTRAEQLLELQSKIQADLSEGSASALPESLASRGAHWYAEIVVPTLLAHANDSGETFILNVVNGSTIPWMPPASVVELPTLVRSHGFYPLVPANAPADIQAIVRKNAVMEMLWVEAVVEDSFEKALRAMVLNPLVRSIDQAQAILEEIWPAP